MAIPNPVICLGHVSLDHHFGIDTFPDHPTKTPASSYRSIVGGMGANAAIAAHKLGGQVRLAGRIGRTSQPLGQFLANLMVRRRLADILQEIPNHYSAKMLGIQGAGNRPTIIAKMVLEAELRLAIEPMEWMLKDSAEDFESEQIEQLGVIYESCRTRVDGLVRYSDKADRELISKVQELVSGIRALERAAKSRGETYEVEDAMNAAQETLIRAYAVVAAELKLEKGER